jgi:hypothetical protein
MDKKRVSKTSDIILIANCLLAREKKMKCAYKINIRQ